MYQTNAILIFLGLAAIACAQTTSCSTMFAGLKCRTASDDPSKVDAGAVSGARSWLCNGHPQFCTAIKDGGAFASCNSVQQLSYAMNAYYAQYQNQGASACNFGGVASLYTPSTGPAQANQNQCQTMYSSASCRTQSADPTKVDAAGLASSRNWLCGIYPQFCLEISSGGSYASCTSAEQLTYAMSLYYNQFKAQGASACNFGGLARINTNTNGNANTGNANTPATSNNNANNGVNCTAMFAGLKCRTASSDPNAVDANSVTGSRSWLCTNYPQFCTGINNGGTYARCNSVEQLSYAMNLYYATYGPSQGTGACYFGGVAKLVSGAGSGVVANPTPAPAPNPNPTPAPAPAPSTLSSKAGLAWPINQFGDGTNPAIGPYAQGKISWIYTWSTDPTPAIANAGIEWVPMLHKKDDANAFIARINSGAYDKYTNVLLFNEPDLNYPPYAYPLDVNSAISITLQVFQAMRNRGRTWRVGTPVMAYNQGWLQQYLAGVNAQCPFCKFSFVPIHCYTRDANSFKNTVQSYRNTFGLPVWITEWSQTDFSSRNWQVSLGDVQNFMADTTGWLNAQSWVERYSWFGVMRAVDIQDKANMAMNRDGSRNALGDQYVLRGGAK